jgi:hypothetical protein
MAYDWKNVTQAQLQGYPLLNGQSGMNALMPMNPGQQLLTGKNPNPKFPRARHAWETVKSKPNWQGGAAGAAGGAATGATLGSFFPVVGPAIGAAVGGLAGGTLGLSQTARDFALGQSGGVEQYQNLTPDQQSIIQYLMQLSQEGIENPYEGFDTISQQAQNQFNQQTVPSLAERFTSMGDNSIYSPAFASQIGQAGAGLQGDLAAQRAQYGQQNKQQMIQTLLSLLQPRSENIYRPRQAGAFETAGKTALENIGNIWDVRQKAKALKSLTAD